MQRGASCRPGPRQRGYNGRWEKARAAFLQARPWCAWCAEEGRQIKAEHVHHAEPHKGDSRKFWDRTKWVPLCAAHHNGRAQQQERHGYHGEVGSDGLPTDPKHPFNRG